MEKAVFVHGVDKYLNRKNFRVDDLPGKELAESIRSIGCWWNGIELRDIFVSKLKRVEIPARMVTKVTMVEGGYKVPTWKDVLVFADLPEALEGAYDGMFANFVVPEAYHVGDEFDHAGAKLAYDFRNVARNVEIIDVP